MNKLLVAAAFAAVAAATPAFAADTGTTKVLAEQAQVCKIVHQDGQVTLADPGAPVAASFVYQCNFIGSPVLKFTSANGGVKTDSNANGDATVDYAIYLNDAAPSIPVSAWLKASGSQGGVSYAGNGGGSITTSQPANTDIAPSFQVALLKSLPVAGTYSDTLTISINP